MARNLPTIPDDKYNYYADRLFRELSNMFEWKGLPEEIPVDYLERNLIRHGQVMLFYDDEYGYLALRCSTRGINIYEKPVMAYTATLATETQAAYYERNIAYAYTEEMDKKSVCVRIENMYDGKSMYDIIDFTARRLALVQQAFDTNAMWQNIPVVFTVPDSDTKLSVEKMFTDIFQGKPWVIVDKLLLAGEKPLAGAAVQIPFLLADLYDAKNEIMAEFRETVGISTPGADKKERLLVDEVNANNQGTETALQVMLGQRQRACELMNKVFGLNVTVNVRGIESEVKDDGGSNSGTENGSVNTNI